MPSSPVRVCVALAAVAVISSACRVASAHPSAHLSYTRGEGAGSCPDEEALRAAVATRLGYDPFDPSATQRIDVSIAASRTALRATIVLVDEGGNSQGEKTLTGSRSDCAELAASAALAVSIAIDPLALTVPAPPAAPPATRPPPPPDVPPPPPPLPSAPPAPAPMVVASASPPPREAVHLRLGVVGLGSVGTLPAPSVGAAGVLSVLWRPFELGLEGRAELAQSEASSARPGGAVEASLLAATLAPCVHLPPLVGCVVGSFGAIQGQGVDLDVIHHVTTPYAAAGLRLGGEVPLGRVLRGRAQVDGLVNLTRATLAANNVDVWTSPPVSALLSAGLLGQFL